MNETNNVEVRGYRGRVRPVLAVMAVFTDDCPESRETFDHFRVLYDGVEYVTGVGTDDEEIWDSVGMCSVQDRMGH